MTIREVRAALTALLKQAAPGVPVSKSDTDKPVVRPSFKIDIFPAEGNAACGGARERFRAPRASRMPISFVRSCAADSMLLNTPSRETSSAMPPTAKKSSVPSDARCCTVSTAPEMLRT